MISLITCFYDVVHNESRKSATLKAVQHWMEQSHLPDEMLFLELGFNGVFTFTGTELPSQMKYIRIDGNDSNKYLFQKEHLWNLAARMARNEKLMFIDSDVAPLKNVDWFKKVSDSLDTCLFTQGFGMAHYLDQGENKIGGSSYQDSFTKCIVNNEKVDVSLNTPGMAFCTSKEFVSEIDGFNYLPLGGGDSLFWNELYEVRQDFPWFIVFSRDGIGEKVDALSEKLGKSILGNVDVEINHFFHGDRKGRSYIQRQFLLATQYPVLDQLIREDENGLLAWVDDNYWFVKAISQLPTVNNDETLASTLVEKHIDYNKFVNQMWGLIYQHRHRQKMTKLEWVQKICQLAKENSKPH